MTSEEANEIIGLMKAGKIFSEEENDYLWSYSYDAEKNKFNYIYAWLVIGAVLSDAEYSEKEFRDLLIKDFSYRDFIG